MRLAPILVLAVGLALSTLAAAPARAGNPFLGGGGGSAAARAPAGYPGLLQPLMERVARAQMEIKERLTGFAERMRADPWGKAFRLFLLLSLGYGVAHALGPGHGKVYVCSYFLARPAGLRLGLALGGLTMFLHVLSATVLVMGGCHLFRMSGALAVEQAEPRLLSVSYGALLAVGLFLFAKALREARQGGHDRSPSESKADLKGLAGTALAVGLAPCPGASLILVYAVAMGLTAQGLLAMAAVAVGMGLTTSLFAVLAITARNTLSQALERRGRALRVAHAALAMGGSLCIALLGGILLLGSF